jgi:hypothetical protein
MTNLKSASENAFTLQSAGIDFRTSVLLLMPSELMETRLSVVLSLNHVASFAFHASHPCLSRLMYGLAVAYASSSGGTQLVIAAENGWDPVSLAAAGTR